MELNAIFEESNAECAAEFESIILFDSVGRTTEAGGEIFSDYDNNEANAEYAAAFGKESKAHGVASFASGTKKEIESDTPYPVDADGNKIVPDDAWRYNEAVGTASTAMGMGNVAFARASKAFGFRTQTGYPPTEEWFDKRPELVGGTNTENVGQAAFAIGADTVALENHSIAGGWRAIARGKNSLALGSAENYTETPTEASGYGAVAIGKGAKSSGSRSVAMGIGVKSSGKASTALGENTTASGQGSFAVGVGSTASNYTAFTCGENNTASGMNSFAGGSATKASNTNSVAIGRGLKTAKSNQAVFGQYNATHSNALLSVGSGSSDTNRKNAFSALDNGNAIIAGTADIGGNCFVKGKLSFGSVDSASIQKTFFKADLMEGVDLVDNMAVTGLGLQGEYDGQLAVSRNNGYCRAYIWLASAWVKIAEVEL